MKKPYSKLQDLKYIYRSDIRYKAALEANFRDHFQRLNKVNLSDSVLVVSEQKSMIMRLYQIFAFSPIADCIQKNRGNGYIRHTAKITGGREIAGLSAYE